MTTYKIEGTTMRKILTNLLHDAGIAAVCIAMPCSVI